HRPPLQGAGERRFIDVDGQHGQGLAPRGVVDGHLVKPIRGLHPEAVGVEAQRGRARLGGAADQRGEGGGRRAAVQRRTVSR
ncbi:MAG: hypothetical protein ACK559_24030, partial [bacterium]